MTSALPATPGTEARTDKIEGGLDVDWLLRAKKDPLSQAKAQKPKPTPQNSTPAPASTPQTPQPPPKAVQKPDSHIGPTDQAQDPSTPRPTNGPVQTPPPAEKSPFTATVTPPPQQPSQDDTKGKAGSGNKKDSKRPSWFSSLGHKLSTGGSHTSRNSSVDSTNSRKSPQPSPRVERGNPFNDKNGPPDGKSEPKPVVYTHTTPRRPSVLVAAGTETKLESQPGFLTSALRRFSSGGAAQLAKAPSTNGAIYPRKIMNIDRNRERSRISEFDQAKLRRVAFKVDVEIAGIAAQGDEQYDPQNPAGIPVATPNLNIIDEPKDLKLAKQKDKSEGAALKRSASKEASENSAPQQAALPEPKPDAAEEKVKQQVESQIKADESNPTPDGTQPPTTRKKEKKKRTEAERKERKERKRRHAEANGLVPLELTVQDDDSDSSPSNTPTGATTPRKGQPTTDPLRIYKRCCQLRETTALTILKEQISKPSATLAEAPGIVASLDVSGNDFTLQDIQTLGDWLAVVPVRRLILDNCNLSDEGLRIILSGLSSCKSQEQARHNRKLPKRNEGKPGQEQLGVIEKLSLKHNSDITSIGWKYIAQFLHMNCSLRGIDLSGIPFPAMTDLSRTSTNTLSSNETGPPKTDLGTLFAKALSQRFGTRLEEMILNGCTLPSAAIPELIDSAVACNIKRLGFANNKLDSETVPHFERYIMSGMCEGMDLGGNDFRGSGHRLTKVMDAKNPFFALSLADCNLSVDDLKSILQNLALSHNFKFLDVSHNHDLCNGPEDAIPVLRRYLPKMLPLKRIHLADLDMNTSQLIALAEVLPDCRELAHVSVLENVKLVECMNSPEGKAQEEACAVFVSLMTAVRTSTTLVAVEIEVPGQDSSEIVKALASQVVAYGLRNFERTTFGDDAEQAERMPDKLDKQAPEILLHLVGHMEGYSENHDNDDPAPDDDYVLASSGIIKALDVCLGSRETALRSGNISPSGSGTATPRSGQLMTSQARKPKNVSIELCESARKIRLRLRPAMVKEDRAGNMYQYRRLMMLDQTLQGIIQRFEDEYPDAVPEAPLEGNGSRASSFVDPTPRPQDSSNDPLDRITSENSQEDDNANRDGQTDPFSLHISRTSSHTSLAARNLTQEEGRMHRFGQSIRREVLRPTGTDDFLHGTSVDDEPESADIAALRAKLEQMKGEEIRSHIEKDGADNVLKQLGFGVQDLYRLMEEDPEGFEVFKHSQMAAQINAGLITGSEEDVKRAKEHAERSVYGGHSSLSTHQAVTRQ